MLLTLVPPSSDPIPETLQTHLVSVPSWPAGARVSAAWNRAASSLQTVGISVPSVMCVDLTSWCAFAVQEVVWDLDSDFVSVQLVDGTEERFTLECSDVGDHAIKSDEMVTTSDDDSMQSRASTPLHRSDWMHSTSSPQRSHFESMADPFATIRPRHSRMQDRKHPVRARLLEISRQIREAFEDNTLGPLSIDCESDHNQLLRMAADATLKIPPSWDGDAQSLFEFHMTGSSDGSDREEEDETSSENENAESRSLRQASVEEAQRRRREVTPGTPFDLASPKKLLCMLSGQLESRRRPRSLAEIVGTQGPPPHDYLSFVEVLAKARNTMLDIFALKVCPALKARLKASTYCEWAAKSAADWCRMRAHKLSGTLANRVSALLEQEESSEGESNLVDELFTSSDECSKLRSYQPLRSISFGTHNATPLRNPLQDMKDDYQLRLWCEQALQRSDTCEVPPRWGQQAAVPGFTFGAPKFSRAPTPWEVTTTLPAGLGKASGLRAKLQQRLSAKLSRHVGPTSSSPLRTASCLGRRQGRRTAPKSVYPESSDTESEIEDVLLPLGPAAQSPKFFYPEDWLGDALLPSKLPKVLVDSDIQPPLSKDIERSRKTIHMLLNEIAGLQKRIVELMDYIVDRKHARENAWQAVQPEANKGRIHRSSGLRNPVTESTQELKTRYSPPASMPLRMQPLRLRTGDKAVSAAIAGASKDRAKQLLYTTRNNFVSAKARSRSPPSPRKRARDNLSAIKSVLSASQTRPRKRKAKDRTQTVAPKRRRKEQGSTHNVYVREDEDDGEREHELETEADDESLHSSHEDFVTFRCAAPSAPSGTPRASRLSLSELGTARKAYPLTVEACKVVKDGQYLSHYRQDDTNYFIDDDDAQGEATEDEEEDENVNTRMPRNDAEEEESDTDLNGDGWGQPLSRQGKEADIMVQDLEEESREHEMPLALPNHVIYDLEAMRADTPASMPINTNVTINEEAFNAHEASLNLSGGNKYFRHRSQPSFFLSGGDFAMM
ncbi:hypothetical protein OIV83_005228 [Microbotryomycetes sp. JL201]|nr:hypothetical protein OIV83_005228 [Microbotryomycetes sp. JL201]